MMLEKIKKSFHKSMNNDISMRIYAVIISITAWFFISTTVNPTTSIHIKDVPITIDLAGTSAERNELSVVSQDIQNVTVQIEGNRSVIGNLRADDLVASAVIDNITASGKYILAIDVTSKSDKEFDVLAVRPSAVTVELDKIVSKTFDVVAEAPNAKADVGFIKGDPVASPSVITVTGPEEQLNKITKCAVRTDYGNNQEPLKESYEVTSGNELVLYNNTAVMNTDDFEIDNKNFSIQIPIYMKKELNFKLTFNNVPSGFPIEDLKYTLDTPVVEVAAPNDSLENVEEIHLGYVDLREIDIGTVLTFPVELPEGFQNLTGVQTVTVTFNSDGFIKKKININNKNISIINAPPQFDIQAITSGFDVTFVGNENVLNSITTQDVVTQVDLLGVDIQSGEYFNAAVTFLVPNKGLVWALDSYTATFRATLKK